MKNLNLYTYIKKIAWFIVLLNTLSCVGQNPANKPQTTKLSGKSFDIAMVTFPGYAPLYLAQEKGFFGKLEVKLHRIEDIATMRTGMARKELEAYLATTDIALDTNSRPEGVAIWAIDESSGGDGVVVKNGIESLADLKGKKIATEPGFPPHFILLYLLKQANLSSSDVKLQDMTTLGASTAFTSKSVDAAAIYEPYLTQATKDRKGSKVIISSADVPGLIVDSIFVREDVLAREGDILQLIKGWRKAVAYIQINPEESYKIMAKAYNMDVKDFKDIASAVRWLDLDDNQKLYGDGNGLLFKNFTKIREVLKANRRGVYDAKPEEHLSSRFVKYIETGY